MPEPGRADLWLTYARHAALLFATGPRPQSAKTDCRFVALSGAPHLELNQAALYGQATEADAREIARLALDCDVPMLVARSHSVPDTVAEPLRAARFARLAVVEHTYWMPGVPALRIAGSFAVRAMASDDDHRAMESMFAEVHGYSRSIIASLFGRAVRAGDGVTGWMAWDGSEPVSSLLVTECDGWLGLWDVMTPARHRRRGAASQLIVAALNEVARTAARPIVGTLFWSSPAGAPLYEALGFRVGDTLDAWALGATPAELAASGADLAG